MNPIHIHIVDDHALVAESLGLMLSTVQGFVITGTSNNGWQALQNLENNPAHVVLADYHMPLLNGVQLTHKLKETQPDVRCILLTMSEEVEHIKEAVQAGAYGYVMKSAEKQELVTAIEVVAKGGKYFSDKIVKKLSEISNPDTTDGTLHVSDISILTRREIEIINLIGQDCPNLEIAKRLAISNMTVETHRRNIMKKLGINSAIGLMRWGLKNGLINQEMI